MICVLVWPVQTTLRVVQDACDLDMREKAVRTIQDLLNSDPSGALKSLYVQRSAQEIIEQGTKGKKSQCVYLLEASYC